MAMFVENITNVKGEEEVLFPSGTYFIVESITENKEFSITYPDQTTDKKILIEIKIIIPLYFT